MTLLFADFGTLFREDPCIPLGEKEHVHLTQIRLAFASLDLADKLKLGIIEEARRASIFPDGRAPLVHTNGLGGAWKANVDRPAGGAACIGNS